MCRNTDFFNVKTKLFHLSFCASEVQKLHSYIFLLQADRRLLLTGTPLQNNLLELMSLLAFVMPDIFTSKTEHLKKIFHSMSVS